MKIKSKSGFCDCRNNIKFEEYRDKETGRFIKTEINFKVRRNFGRNSRGYKVCKVCGGLRKDYDSK